MSSDPAQETMARHDATITLVVSGGPEPITIPNVIGATEQTALETLAFYELDVSVQHGRTLEVPTGQVYQQDPAGDAAGFRAQAMTIWVSDGKPIVTVQDYRTLDKDVAKAQAENLGLVGDPEEAELLVRLGDHRAHPGCRPVHPGGDGNPDHARLLLLALQQLRHQERHLERLLVVEARVDERSRSASARPSSSICSVPPMTSVTSSPVSSMWRPPGTVPSGAVHLEEPAHLVEDRLEDCASCSRSRT